MGNTGRPSTGCSRCRKRRVKCDERRPGCLRCEKLREECPGYTHGYWIFRDESDTARKRVLKQSRANGSTTPSRSSESIGTASPPSEAFLNENSSTNSLVVSRRKVAGGEDQVQSITITQPSIFTDIEFRAVCLFMETFTLDASTEGPFPAHLDFLPDMYMSSSPDSSIQKAVTAISLTNFANRYGAKDLASTAWKAYGEALQATNTALRNPITATSDAQIAAVYLLGLNELICRPDMPLLGGLGWSNHIFGTLQLLQLRWTKKLKSTTELQLLHMVHHTVLIKQMMCYEPPPSDSMGFILAQDFPEGLGAKIATAFFIKAIDMRSRIYKKGTIISSNSDADSTELEMLVNEACALLRSQSFENWTDNEPAWQVKVSTAENASKWDKYSFESLAVSTYWIYHWTTKVCLQKSVIDGYLVILTNLHDPEEFAAVQEKIIATKEALQATVEKILGSVEYCLTGFCAKKRDPSSVFDRNRVAAVTSSVGALPMFWALGTIKRVPYSDVLQKALATDALRRIGTENSIAQALLHLY